MSRPTTTTEQLHEKLWAEFGETGGTTRLAAALGVSVSTASNLMRAKKQSSMVKAAAYYGYEPAGEADVWIQSETPRDPRDVGYRHRWTQAVLEDLRKLMDQPKGKRPRVSTIARRIGVSPSTMRGIMRKADIKLREQERQP